MPTVTKTIGSGARDYATPALWEAALPANFVTDGNSQIGQMFNDSEFVISSGSGYAFSAHTTDATHTMTLTTGAGQSFQDNASVRTNALKYNVANGVGIRMTVNYGAVISIAATGITYLTISKIQIARTNTGAGVAILNDQGPCIQAHYQDLLLEVAGTSGNVFLTIGTGGAVVISNVFVNVRASSTAINAFTMQGGNTLLIGCGVVRSSNLTAAGVAYHRIYGVPILQSSYSFGMSTASDTGWDGTNSKKNATDQTSIAGTSAQTSVTYSSATPFTSGADSTRDFRAIAATSLASNGFKDSTNAPNDISGTVRAASPTIGPWEIASVAAQVNMPPVVL